MARPLAQARPSSAGLRYLTALLALAPAPALAGAWVAPEGGQEIVTTVAGERDEVSFVESSIYWEAPFGEATSVVVSPWVEQDYASEDGWRAEATIGVKRAIFRGDTSVMAVQGGALWMSHPQPGCREGGLELRWLGGTAFGESGFANVEVASRALDGGCGGERVDMTVGFRPSERWLGMAQLFLDDVRDETNSLKAQVTLVRFWGPERRRGLQLGVRARIDDGASEPALVIGFWGRPGD